MKAGTAILTAVTALGIASAASAQGQNCGQRAAVIASLADRYGESRQSIGMATEGRVIEVFASLESGTWTITVTLPNGMTCLVASGQSYENLNEPLQPAGIQS
ncbi:MAG: hypothetical protein KJO67_01950 [Silicimonas sp.]|nr:hypothetical protein [Silicimonas sp.]NNL36238.1 hypothetical protein [Silicimonas sp.]RZW06867.1 MAG: hypothetical protein EX266_07040 [Paracoccaceae bacterium]